jgi:hypothetical protein
MRPKRNYDITCVILFYVIHVYSLISSFTCVSEKCVIHRKKESENCVISNKCDKVTSLKIQFFFIVLHPNPRTLLCYRFFIRDQRPFSARDGICMVLELYGVASV